MYIYYIIYIYIEREREREELEHHPKTIATHKCSKTRMPWKSLFAVGISPQAFILKRYAVFPLTLSFYGL